MSFGVTMKPIRTEEINSLRFAIQHFQDCYLVSSVGALANSTNGRRILSENIAHTQDGFRVRFRNINGQTRDFFVTQKEMDNLIYMDKYCNPIEVKIPHNPIVKAIEVAMEKPLTQNPGKKPWICRFPRCNEKFEFNKPSNFLEMFTGIKPTILNESGLMLTLRSKQKTAANLFERIKHNPDNSFVGGTSIWFNKDLMSTHCYSLNGINKDSLEIFDHRQQKNIRLTFQDVIKKMKFIVGYFNDDLV